MKENYVNQDAGIIAFKEDPKVEIQSPFRKKRGTLVKLKTVADDDEEDAQIEKLEAELAKIQPFFDKVMSAFEEKQNEFKDL